MAYYCTCHYCGSNLDPGEKCTCQGKLEKLEREFELLTITADGGQIKIGGLLYGKDNKD